MNYERNNTTTKGLRRKNLKKDFETLLRKVLTSLFLINSLGHCRQKYKDCLVAPRFPTIFHMLVLLPRSLLPIPFNSIWVLCSGAC